MGLQAPNSKLIRSLLQVATVIDKNDFQKRLKIICGAVYPPRNRGRGGHGWLLCRKKW